MLEEIEKYIENFKIIIFEKDKQLYDLKNILKAAKNSYQQVTKENKQLKQHITTMKHNNNNTTASITTITASTTTTATGVLF